MSPRYAPTGVPEGQESHRTRSRRSPHSLPDLAHPPGNATTYTLAQSGATVAAAGALRGGLVFAAFEIGVIFGSFVNAAAVQPLLGSHLGISGCEG